VRRSLLVIPLMLLAVACQARGPSKITEGVAAPDFTLPSTQGDRVSLADYRGERSVLLYFSMGPG
jgi:cytochrome oxidase Cu insertion factor (SCO1/SenC/PrrC family)